MDDSIGEAYDKIARYLGLGYPGGPVLDRLAGKGADVLNFPRPMIQDGYEFSFSGLKTAVVNYVRKEPAFVVADVAASFVAACMDVLCAKIRRALGGIRRPGPGHRRGGRSQPGAARTGPTRWPRNSAASC